MKYYTYWTIADTPSHSIRSTTIFLLILFASGLVWLIIKNIKNYKDNVEKKILLWGSDSLFTFSMVAFLVQLNYPDKTTEQINKYYKSPDIKIVEGTIKNFSRVYKQERYGTQTTESFDIDTVHFSYTSGAMGNFNEFGKVKNGLFANGVQLRITYLPEHNFILKIEIAH